MSDDELRKLWRAAGGAFHGPNIETGTMPESKLLPFLRNLAAPQPDSAPQDSGKRAAFEAYLDGPFSELADNDAGRSDARRLCFEDFGIPLDLVFYVWQAALAQKAVPIAANGELISELDILLVRLQADPIEREQIMQRVRNLVAAKGGAPIAVVEPLRLKPNPEETGVGQFCQPGDQREPRWFLTFDDVDRGHSIFETEEEAREGFANAEGMGWNCWLFSPTPRGTHPAPIASTREAPLTKLAHGAVHALRSYQFGNSSPDLAKDVADKLEAALKDAP